MRDSRSRSLATFVGVVLTIMSRTAMRSAVVRRSHDNAPNYHRLWVAALALLVACGTDALTGSEQIAFEPTFDEFANAEWSEPVNLGPVVNSTATELEVSISRDGLSLYIASNRSGNFDIWVSHREGDDEPWGPPQPLDATINTAAREQAPFISRDGHFLYFFSDRDAVGGTTDIYVSRRRGKRDDFGWEAPVNLGSGVNSTANETLPVLFEDDATGTTTLYFSSNRPGLGGGDIYASALQPDGTFGPAALVAELSSPRRDRVLTIRRDGLEIFLASDRPGPTQVPFDLWVATRASTSHPWSTPVNLGSVVNSAADEGGAAISFDGRTLYFTSDRLAPSGRHDIWVTTRAKPRSTDEG